MTLGSFMSSRPGARVRVLALVQHVAAVADLQAAAGVLFHHDDGNAGPVDLVDPEEGLVLFDGGEAGRRLIEQQHGRVPSSGPVPMATIWRSPPEREPARWARRFPSSGKRLVTNSNRSAKSLGRWNMPICMFSSMVKVANTLLFCGTNPTPWVTSLLAFKPGEVLAPDHHGA